jgi:hypothetical protein
MLNPIAPNVHGTQKVPMPPSTDKRSAKDAFVS